jgi:hypothetical protein
MTMKRALTSNFNNTSSDMSHDEKKEEKQFSMFIQKKCRKERKFYFIFQFPSSLPLQMQFKLNIEAFCSRKYAIFYICFICAQCCRASIFE